MKIDTIKSRLENTKSKISKTEITLDRHKKALAKMITGLESAGVDLNNYDKYSKELKNLYWDLYKYEDKKEAVKNTDKKLKQLYNDLEKLTNLLDVEIAKKDNINNIIPACILDFLEEWKLKAKQYFINITKEYIHLHNKEYEVTKKELEQVYCYKYVKDEYTNRNVRILAKQYSDDQILEILNSKNQHSLEIAKNDIKDRYINLFESNHKSDMNIVDKILKYHEIIDYEKLDKILDDEVEVKKEMFIDRVSKVVGVVKEFKNFEIGDNGEINGIAIGDKNKAKINTIIAGGYNIQREHFRVLVNKIK